METNLALSKLHIPRDPILIVEDTAETQALLLDLCQDLGCKAEVAGNGKIALDKLNAGQVYSLFIVDLMMPVMDGKTFITFLKKKYPEAVVVVQSALDSSQSIIEVMRLGVFDYVIKPVDPDLFQQTLIKSLEYKYFKDMELYQSLNASKKLRSQMDWLVFKENLRVEHKDSSDIRSIYNLRTTMTQGAGFGALITMLDLMKSSLQQLDASSYKVDRQIVDIVLQNNEYLRNQINGLKAISEILEKEIPLVETDSVTLLQSIPQMISSIDPFLERKKLELTFPEQNRNFKLKINYEKISLCIEELLINAYKYSKPNTTINVFTRMSEGYYWITVKNDVDEHGVISKEDEKMVLEPFFRLMPYDESVAEIERFGIGLGLTVVDNIARKHHGMFMIRSVKDFTTEPAHDSILAEILLPIVES